jgi:4-amino-4-deoxy-L-arabinose transferase-like glycosyltransferase
MTERGWRLCTLGVAVAALLLFLVHLGTLPLFDPDEGYYAAAAAESVDAGSPLDLRLNGEPRWNKPPLAYALIEASFGVLGRDEAAARLPSVLEGALLVALLGLLVARVAGRRSGFYAALVLASAAGFQVMARAAHPEMALVLGTAVAEVVLATWFVAAPGERPRWAWWAAGLAMGFGFLAKGPIAVLLPALMLVAGMFVVPREGRPSWGETGRVFGAAAAVGIALAAPWFVWMGGRHEGFWGTAFGQLAHYTSPEHEHYGNNPLYFVPVLVGGFLPWTLFLPGALRHLRRTDPEPRARLRLLMSLAAGTSFLFWSLSTSKLPNYGLVFLPPLAVVAAIEMRSGSGRTSPAVTLRSKLPCLAIAALGVLVAAAPALFGLFTGDVGNMEFEGGTVVSIETPPDSPWNEALAMSCYLGGLFLLLGGAFGLATRSQTLRILALALPWLLLPPAAVHWWRDYIEQRHPARDFAALFPAGRGPGDPLVVYRARLPSLSFYARTSVPRLLSPEELWRIVDGPGRAWVVLRKKHYPELTGGTEGPAAEEAILRRFDRMAQGGEFVLLREK